MQYCVYGPAWLLHTFMAEGPGVDEGDGMADEDGVGMAEEE